MNAIAPAASDVQEALDFLRELPHRVVNLVAISPAGGPPVGVTRPQGHPNLAAFVKQHAGAFNLYFSANEPKPDAPDRKLTKDDVARITTIFADIDPAAGADLAAERLRLRALADDLSGELWAPTYTIDSGGGVQLLWRLREPLDATPENIAAVEAQGRGIAAKLGGDPVQNIDRVMRLPGTTNFPNAKKRAAGRKSAPSCIIGRAAWPITLPALASFAPPLDAPPATAGATAYNGPLDMGEVMEASNFDELPAELHERFAAACAANPRLTALWRGEAAGLRDVSRSGFDFAVAGILKHAGFTATEAGQILWTFDHGRGPDLDERDIRRAYGRAPEPHDLPSATDEFSPVAIAAEHLAKPGAPEAARRFSITPRRLSADFDAKRIPPRPWLLGTRLMTGALTVCTGAPGSNKSTLAISTALALITGRDDITSERVARRGRVFLANAEDAADEIERRVGAACLWHNVRPTDIAADFLFHAADDTPLVFAHRDRGVPSVNEAAVRAVIEMLRDQGCAYAVFDPLIALQAGLDENANAEMALLADTLARIAREAGCAVEAVHHVGKSAAATGAAMAGSMTAGRGAFAIMGRARIGFTVVNDGGVIRVDGAKGSYAAKNATALRFRVEAVSLENGTPAAGEFNPFKPDAVPHDTAPVLVPLAENEAAAIAERRKARAAASEQDHLARAVADAMGGNGSCSLGDMLAVAQRALAAARGVDKCGASTAREVLNAALREGRLVETDSGPVVLRLRPVNPGAAKSPLTITKDDADAIT